LRSRAAGSIINRNAQFFEKFVKKTEKKRTPGPEEGPPAKPGRAAVSRTTRRKEEKAMEKRVSTGVLIMGILFLLCFTGCAMKEAKPPEEPVAVDYNIRFVDMDKNGDGVMTVEEFRAYFPNGDELIFGEADMNANGVVEHTEWHIYKKISGFPEKEGHGERP